MKVSLALLAVSVFPLAPLAAGEPLLAPASLLRQVLAEPGQYNQMCSLRPMIPEVPLSIYGFVNLSELHLSEANLSKLRARRAEIIPALNEHLAKLQVQSGGSGSEQAVAFLQNNPDELGVPLYEVIIDLDAVETLPALLNLEAGVAEFLAKEPASVAAGSFAPAEIRPWRTKATQRDLLSMMLQLLRRQRFQPVLDSAFEKAYAAAIRTGADKDDLRDLKTPADAKAQGKTWVRIDPIYQLPVSIFAPKPEVPFTTEIRTEVRGFAERFLKTVSPQQWLVNTDVI